MTANFLQVMEGSRLRSGHFLRCSLLAKCRLHLAQQVTALAHTLQRTRNFEASLHLVFQLKFFFVSTQKSSSIWTPQTTEQEILYPQEKPKKNQHPQMPPWFMIPSLLSEL